MRKPLPFRCGNCSAEYMEWDGHKSYPLAPKDNGFGCSNLEHVMCNCAQVSELAALRQDYQDMKADYDAFVEEMGKVQDERDRLREENARLHKLVSEAMPFMNTARVQASAGGRRDIERLCTEWCVRAADAHIAREALSTSRRDSEASTANQGDDTAKEGK